ncbi:flavin monoamine oxidase family protein [Streptomyces sp. NPDC001678]|uniref:flavin monoamine oxidase family protein n=1 Tax=Streptomyces sp. NPDC001678 TaxID=3364599 RepID=UPI00368364A9
MHSHGANSSIANAVNRRFGRRSLLKGIGAGALTAGLGAAGQGIAHAEEESLVDVVIIGAGYAGAMVARELGAKGLSTVVLEASDRVGGRIWTDTWAGEQIEVGGQWLAPQHQLVNKELARYNITTYGDPIPDRVIVAGSTGLKAVTPDEAAKLVVPLWTEFYKGSEKYFERPAEPLYRKDLLAAVDPLSLADRIKQMNLSPTEVNLLTGETSVYSGGPSTLGSLTGMAQWYQLAGGTYEAYTNTIGRRPVGGMTAILNAMLRENFTPVVKNSPVTRISDPGTGKVTVYTASGRRYKAPAVVVATSTNAWKNITFEPGLPKAHALATTQGIGVPHGTKMWLHIKGKIDATTGTAPEGSPILMMVPQKQLADGRLMIAFTGPGLDVNNPVKVQEAVQQWIPGAQVLKSRAMAWGTEKWAAGAWGFRRPGQLTGLFPQIEQPHGRILFAGADIAQGWHGAFIEGALESGLRASSQALNLVK